MTTNENALLPGSAALWTAAAATTAARGHGLRRWSKDDKASLRLVLEYVRRSYKAPAAVFPYLVPNGMGRIPAITCGNHHVAQFTSFDCARAAEAIARQAAEACGLRIA